MAAGDRENEERQKPRLQSLIHSLTHHIPVSVIPPFLMDGTPTLRSGLHIQGCDTGAHPAVSRAAKWHACHFH